MAKALAPGRRVKGRPVFGLFDPDGWGWATTKATFWLLVLIMVLGYVPDRAYYFVVSRTLELGILGWSPVNLCPPENGAAMPCPAPAGAVVPWQSSPAGAALPEARTGGTAAQLGTNLLYIGGTDGSAPTSTTYVATIENGNFGGWTEGPALPEARADAAIAILSGTAYLIGGTGPDGEPTTTVWSIGLDPDSGALGTWSEVGGDPEADPPVPGLALPEARSGAGVVAVTDGIVVAGGRGPGNAPVATVWKSTLDNQGALGEFKPQSDLFRPVADATMVLEGTFLWLYGGSDAAGATASVQRAQFGSASTADQDDHGAAAPTATPAASGEAGEKVGQWAVQDAANLPGPRTGAAGWAANGAIYLAGGTDGTSAKRELYWALPDADGNLRDGWHHLDATDLPNAVVDGAPVVSGATVFILGGTVDGSPTTGSMRASLAPQEPFFRLGIAGVVIPALQLGGEIGQQLGYLAAAGVGTGNFVLLVALGWAFNNRRKIADWRERRRIAKEARAPKASA